MCVKFTTCIPPWVKLYFSNYEQDSYQSLLSQKMVCANKVLQIQHARNRLSSTTSVESGFGSGPCSTSQFRTTTSLQLE